MTWTQSEISSIKGDKETRGVPGLGGSWAGGPQLWLLLELRKSPAEGVSS